MSKRTIKPEAVIFIAVVAGVLILSATGFKLRGLNLLGTGEENGENGGAWFTFPEFNIPDTIINVFYPESGDDDDGDDAPPPPPPEDDAIKPTGLTITLSHGTRDMGQYVVGFLTSDGYKYPVKITVRHKGSGETTIINGLIDTQGKFTSDPYQTNTPGYYDIQAEADGVMSNTATLTVRGIRVVGEGPGYSKTFRDQYLIKVYTHYGSSNAGIVGHYPSGGYSKSITSTSINSGGYGEVGPNLDSLANGDWELDAVIGSDQATAWGGGYWVKVGR